MLDFEKLIPPWESGVKDGFAIVEHPDALKEVWKVANAFPAISVGSANADARRRWYGRFRNVIKVQGAFRKGGRESNRLWSSIQENLTRLEATG